MWSVRPLTPARLTSAYAWERVADTNVTVVLAAPATRLLVSYHLVARAHRTQPRPGADFVDYYKERLDYLQLRLAVDGAPYRQSSAYAAPAARWEDHQAGRPPLALVAGNLVVELGPGSHAIELQWKKAGPETTTWSNLPDASDGHTSGRSIVVTGQHQVLEYSDSPQDDAITSAYKWEELDGSTVSFELPEPTSVRLLYGFTAQADPVAPSSAGRGIGRLAVDGVPYREGSAAFALQTKTAAVGHLGGDLARVLALPAGNHTAALEWRRAGAGVPAWRSRPSFLDGFAGGRFLAAMAERFEVRAAQSLVARHLAADASWAAVGGASLQFHLHARARVLFTYALPVTQHGNPNFDQWTWERWSTVASRLVVDGAAYRSSGAEASGTVRARATLRGQLALTLAAGTHTAALQWQAGGGADRAADWVVLNALRDGFSGAETLLVLVNALNNAPVLAVPDPGAEGRAALEDVFLLEGTRVTDIDEEVAENYELLVDITVPHGVVTLAQNSSLAFELGSGAAASSRLRFRGPLGACNRALATLRYLGDRDWYGNETITVRVDDQMNLGAGPAHTDTKEISFEVLPQNDLPVISIPIDPTKGEGFELDEDGSLYMDGISIVDVDADSGEVIFRMVISTTNGFITLGSVEGLEFEKGDGHRDAFVSFLGSIDAINAANKNILYAPKKDFNTYTHTEFLSLYVQDVTGEEQFGVQSTAAQVVPLVVHALNDAPAVSLPAYQLLNVRGLYLADRDYNASANVTLVLTVDAPHAAVRLPAPDPAVAVSSEGPSAFSGAFRPASVVRPPLSWTSADGFAEGLFCQFGAAGRTAAALVSDSELRCAVPAAGPAGRSVLLRVTNGADFSSSAVQFFFERPVVLEAVAPARGGAGGGAGLTVRGRGFAACPDLACSFSSGAQEVRVPAVWLDDATIQCTAPPLSKGQVTLRVTTNAVDLHDSSLSFLVEDSEVVVAMEPSTGPSVGGTEIMIQGANFDAQKSVRCNFGLTSSQATVLNATAVSCTVPSATAIVQDAHTLTLSSESSVLALDGQEETSISLTRGETYVFWLPAGEVNSTRLSAMKDGVHNGGTAWENGVTMDDSTGALIFKVPEDAPIQLFFYHEHIPGSADGLLLKVADALSSVASYEVIQCSLNGVDFSSSPMVFHYIATPLVFTMTPAQGLDSGVGAVLLHGSGFSNEVEWACLFGNQTSFGRFVSNHLLECDVPAAAADSSQSFSVDVGLSVNGVDFASTGQTFTWVRMPRLISVDPPTGPLVGGTLVSVVGSDFSGLEKLNCRFGDWNVEASLLSPELVVCRAPQAPVAGAVNVSLYMEDLGLSESLTFTYITVSVSAFAPREGPVDGGTSVFITGEGFSLMGDIVCEFSGQVVGARRVSDTEIICVTPAADSPGTGTFDITTPTGDKLLVSSEEFYYHEQAQPLSIGPSAGSVQGGTVVTIAGDGIEQSEGLSCFFGNVSVHALVAAGHAQCVAPPVSSAGLVDVTLSQNGKDISSATLSYLYYEDPILESVVPSQGLTHGSTLDTIITGIGFYFLGDPLCKFGNTSVRAFFVNSSAMSCSPPPHLLPEDVDVSVSLNGVDFCQTTLTYSYRSAVLTSIEPSVGYLGGNTPITIRGAGFTDVEDPTVMFGNQIGEHVEIISSSLITCFSPSSDFEGLVDVALVTSELTSVSLSTLKFMYLKDFILTSLTPVVGTTSGGTEVILTGYDFVPSSAACCKFDSNTTPAVFQSENSILCVSPQHPAGMVEVQFSPNCVDFVSAGLVFEFLPQVSIQDMYPLQGHIGGGTPVTIIGDGFVDTGSAQCQFGALTVPASVVSPTELLCSAPARSDTSTVQVDVYVSLDGQHFAKANQSYAYIDVNILDIKPNLGTQSGNETVTVTFSQVPSSGHVSCCFRQECVEAQILGETQIMCQTPPSDAAASVTVAVSFNDVDYALAPEEFEYVADPIFISSVQLHSTLRGADSLLLRGSNFPNIHSLQCWFGEAIAVETIWLSSTELLCTPPDVLQKVDVAISLNGGSRISTGFTYNPSASSVGEGLALTNLVSLEMALPYLNTLPDFASELFISTDGCTQTTVDGSGIPLTILDSTPLRTDQICEKGDRNVSDTILRVVDIHPTLGAIDGGTRVEVVVKNVGESAQVKCLFGKALVEAVHTSAHEIICTTPVFDKAERMDFSLSVNGTEIASSLSFTAINTPTVFSMEPQTGSTAGGSFVEVTGAHFVDSTLSACFFGDEKVKAVWVSQTKILCEVPAAEAGTSTVHITFNGVDLVQSPTEFSHQAPVSVLKLVPSSGPATGGGSVTILGENFSFSGDISCRFGGKKVAATFISTSEIRCVAPVYSTGTVSVAVSNDGKVYSETSVEYTFLPTPMIELLEPSQGPFSAGRLLGENGSGFNFSDPLRFLLALPFIGLLNASSFSSNSVSRVSTHFLVNSRHISSKKHHITKSKVIVLKSLEHPEDATTARLPGFGFGEGAAVAGGRSRAQWLGRRLLEARRGGRRWAGRAGGAARWGGGGGDRAAAGGGGAARWRSFAAPMRVARVSPAAGAAAGGTEVVVAGEDFVFSSDLRCHFGNASSPGIFVGPSTVKCQTPSAALGIAPVRISTNGGDFISDGMASFQYIDLKIDTASPLVVTKEGGTALTVMGSGFLSEFNIFCDFEGVTSPAVIVSHEKLTCEAPILEVGFYALSLKVLDDTFPAPGVMVQSVEAPVILSISPAVSQAKGGDVATVNGLNFLDLENFSFLLGDKSVQPTIISKSQVSFPLPALTPGEHPVILTSGGLVVSSLDTFLTVTENFAVTGVSPAFSSEVGGAVIKVFGTGFPSKHSLTCWFGNKPVGAAFVNASELACVAPASTVEKTTLSITLGAAPTTADFDFTFFPAPVIAGLDPAMGPESGGNLVTIFLAEGLTDGTGITCLFGELAVEAPALISSEREQIVCEVPPGQAGLSAVSLKYSGSTEESVLESGIHYTYYEEPHVYSVSPPRASATEANTVHLHGTNFISSASLACLVESTKVPALWKSSSEALCLIPAGFNQVGNVTVEISNNGKDFSSDKMTLAFVPPPTVSSVFPKYGPTSGGVQIQVVGTNFIDLGGTIFCMFNDSLVNATTLDPTTVSCFTPPHSSGESTVRVCSSDGICSKASEGSRYTYSTAVVVTSSTPLSGSAKGSTLVSVFGSGFSGDGPLCRFGDVQVPANVVSNTELYCLAPIHSAGKVRLSVSSNGIDFSESYSLFEFQDHIQLYSVSPGSIPLEGGTLVYLHGSGFENVKNLTCQFDGAVSPGYWLSPSQMACHTPPTKAGQVTVTASNIGGTADSNPLVIVSYEMPYVHSIHPSSGLASGNTAITAYGTNFGFNTKCVFGNTFVQALFVGHSEILCYTPGFTKPGSVSFGVSINGIDLHKTEIMYEFTAGLSFMDVQPHLLGTQGGEELIITVHERALDLTAQNLQCRFGQSIMPATLSEDNTIRCISPPRPASVTTLSIWLNNQELTLDATQLEYHRPAFISSLDPTASSGDGSQFVFLKGRNFVNTRDFACKFGNKYSDEVVFYSASKVSCKVPSQNLGQVLLSVSNNNLTFSSSKTFTYIPRPTVSHADPMVAFSLTATEVVVRGSNFQPTAEFTCVFGSEISAATYLNGSAISCISPEIENGGPVALTVKANGELASGQLEFSFLGNAFVLENITPTQASLRGGSILSLQGKGMGMGSFCEFTSSSQTVIVPATPDGNNATHCVTPRWDKEGPVRVAALHGQTNLSSNDLRFEFSTAATLIGISPEIGWELGGTVLSVAGPSFGQAADWKCVFTLGTVNSTVDATWVSSEVLECVVPALSPGKYTIWVQQGNVFPGATEGLTFSVEALPQPAHIVPKRCLASGGSSITIYGSHLPSSSSSMCRFGPKTMEPAFRSTNALVCFCPTGPPGLTAELSLSDNGQDFISTGHLVQYVPSLGELSVSPTTGKVSGGTVVALSGLPELNELDAVCHFGKMAEPALNFSDGVAFCVAPPQKQSREVAVSISVGDFTFDVPEKFQYIEDPVLYSLNPPAGFDSGKELIRLYGSNFANTLALCCAFGQQTVPAQWISASEIWCTSPAHFPAEVIVSISNNCLDFTGLGLKYSYRPLPVLHSLEPESALQSGGAVVGIKGVNFCKAPESREIGTVTVSLIMYSDTTEIMNDAISFTFLSSVLSLYSTEPSRVPVNTSAYLTLATSGLDTSTAAECVFTGSYTTLTSKIKLAADSQPFCLTPFWPSAEDVKLHLRHAEEVAATSNYLRFSIYENPNLLEITPLAGSELGGTLIHVHGSGFLETSEIACQFRAVNHVAVATVSAEWASPEHITCIAPGAGPGVYSVHVTLNGVDFTTEGLSYEYGVHSAVEAVYPPMGYDSGAVLLKVFGKNLRFSSLAKCRFDGHLDTAAMFISKSEYSCSIPKLLDEASQDSLSVSVSFSLNGNDFLPSIAKYTAVALPKITMISPSSSPEHRNATANVIGLGFFKSDGIVCRFGVLASKGVYKSSTTISCPVPAQAAQSVPVQISLNNGVDFTLNQWPKFTYTSAAMVKHISPLAGPFSGGTLISVYGGGFVNSDRLACRFAGNGVTFGYEGPPSIEVISPSIGSHQGRTVVTVRGKGFLLTGNLVCRFDQYDVVAVFVSSHEISCISPSHPKGITSISVSHNGLDFSDALTFTYIDTPVVTTIHPVNGYLSGGSMVQIQGSGFRDTVESTCRFGDTRVSAQFVSNQELTCITPPGLPGTGIVEVSVNGQEYSASGVEFRYYEEPVIESIYPALGSELGGTTITVTGVLFQDSSDFACHFGDHGHTPAHHVKDHSLECASPAGIPGDVSLALSNNGQDFAKIIAMFTYAAEPQLYSITPDAGLVYGGTEITVHGANFVDSAFLACRFALITVPARFIDAHTILCTAPENPSSTIPLEVSLNGQEFFRSTWVTFRYSSGIEVHSIFPESGPSGGGTVVTVRGAGFVDLPTLHCKFGSQVAAATQYISSDKIKCTAPPGAVEDVLVSVWLSSAISSDSYTVFRYDPDLFLSLVQPRIVSEVVEEAVLLSGLNFVNTGKLSCRYGGSLVVTARWLSQNMVLCPAPKGGIPLALAEKSPAGVFETTVSAANNGEDFAGPVLLEVAPGVNEVLAVSPTTGPAITGGTEVSLVIARGDLTGRAACRFAQVEVPARVVEERTLVCVSPPMDAGNATIEVSLDGVYFIDAGIEFQYLARPTVKAVYPAQGSTLGGTSLALQGSGFLSGSSGTQLMCQFRGEKKVVGQDMIKHTEATLVSNWEVECLTPAWDVEETVTVEVTANGLDYSMSGIKFTFHRPAKAYAISPPFGPEVGGTPVTIYGANFKQWGDLSCQFKSDTANSRVPALWVSDEELQCTSPTHKPGQVEVGVTLNGAEFTLEPVQYTYYQRVSLSGINPASGAVFGNTEVTIMGNNFFFTSRTLCKFDEQVVPGMFVSNTQVLCTSPAHKEGIANVWLSFNSVDYTEEKVTFSFLPTPGIQNVSPNEGWTTGGELLKITVTDAQAIHPSVLCKFDGIPVKAVLHGDLGIVSCLTPEVLVAGISQLTLEWEGLSNTTGVAASAFPFRFREPVAITSITPVFGTELGGTTVRVLGGNFRSTLELECVFGTHAMPAVWLSSNELLCVTPASPPGHVNFSVAAGSSAIQAVSGITFQYVVPHHVFAVSPSSSSTAGGTLVVVAGARFRQQTSLQCRFGSRVVNATYINATAVSCVSPQSEQTGNVPFGVSLNGADFELAPSGFTFNPSMVISTLSPTFGSVRGGTTLKVQGSGFFNSSSLSCNFGGENSSPAVYTSPTVLRCVTPKVKGLRAATAYVRITSQEEQEKSTNQLAFDYILDPLVAHIAPSRGYLEGGTAVTVTGLNFAAYETTALACRFASEIVPAVYISEDKVKCPSPAQASATSFAAQVALSLNGQDFYATGVTFQYVVGPLFSGLDPSVGPSTGGTVIRVLGQNFHRRSFCRFNHDHTDIAVFISSEELRCIAPAAPAPGTVVLEIGVNQQDFLAVPFEFTYYTAPEVGSLFPIFGDPEGEFEYWPKPAVLYAHPDRAPGATEVEINVYGKNFTNTDSLRCIFGTVSRRATWVSQNEIRCTSPKHIPSRVYLEVSNDGRNPSASAVEFTFQAAPSVLSIRPARGPYHAHTAITVTGSNFDPTGGAAALACRIGDVSVPVLEYRSSHEVVCVAPPHRAGPGSVAVTVTTNNASYTDPAGAPVYYTYDPRVEVLVLNPERGAPEGGQEVLVTGIGFLNTTTLACKFDDQETTATFITSTSLLCTAPAHALGDVPVEVTLNGIDYSGSDTRFLYASKPAISAVWPVLGPAARGGTVVSVRGAHFARTAELSCAFGDHVQPAAWVSEEELLCEAPPYHAREGLVALEVSNDGREWSASGQQFYYAPDASAVELWPKRVRPTGQLPIYVVGANFLNTTALSCRFDSRAVRATFVSEELLVCHAPSHAANFHRPYGAVNVEVSNNGLDWTSAGLTLEYYAECDRGSYCPGLFPQLCPNGTMCPRSDMHNFTLCAPGSFQPQAGQTACLPCPVGYFCPDHGLSAPLLCTAGFVCDALGLVTPVTPCPRGHFCLPGTKTADVRAFNHSAEWAVDNETAVVTFNASSHFWGHLNRTLPETGWHAYEHAPAGADCRATGRCLYGMTDLVAEQPFPCPLGHYCRTGVSSPVPRPFNFSTPQRCFDGYFCPRGSSTPEGSGPCPTGFYCPSQTLAVRCPVGHYCPGVGNTKPLECYPGTFQTLEQQSNCTVCPTGHICPGWGRTLPEQCPRGFVCMALGLSAPVLLCPQGYWCDLGTLTLDPGAPTPRRPYPCPPGTFCLGGVAHNVTVDWVPAATDGATAPQTCTEGAYCQEASFGPLGSGLCFVGHYCPPGTAYPVEIPVGTEASSTGLINPVLCFPGTYSPLVATESCWPCPAGFTCQGYGTYVPSICDAGTYRSLVDSVTCRLCPTGTFQPGTGATDISMCEPCPAGRVCGLRGMSSLAASQDCPAGYTCGAGTDRTGQFTHKCPGGYYCGTESTAEVVMDSICEPGYYCSRGTPDYLALQNKCELGYYCPLGSSTGSAPVFKCPQQTDSVSGADQMVDCFIEEVDVCDKKGVDPYDDGQDMSYYPQHTYTLLDGSETVVSFDSEAEEDATGEVAVVTKVQPVNLTASVDTWANDTIYIYTLTPPQVTVIGRNFRESSLLTCRFRACTGSDVGPRKCLNYDLSNNTDGAPHFGGITVEAPANYVSPTRVTCPVPDYVFVRN
ncbi:unnamed protein product, partial [Heterosigma akashiwo]